ncbi:MAG: hypothetical protein ACRCTE_12455 [Cellulosilyticaceae bacterium]
MKKIFKWMLCTACIVSLTGCNFSIMEAKYKGTKTIEKVEKSELDEESKTLFMDALSRLEKSELEGKSVGEIITEENNYKQKIEIEKEKANDLAKKYVGFMITNNSFEANAILAEGSYLGMWIGDSLKTDSKEANIVIDSSMKELYENDLYYEPIGVKQVDNGYLVECNIKNPDFTRIIYLLPSNGFLTDWYAAPSVIKQLAKDKQLPTFDKRASFLVVIENDEMKIKF